MVNLIPPSAKKGVAIEYWLRVFTVWSIIATVVALLLTITFLPVRVLVEAKINAYQESADVASEKIASYEAASVELNRSTKQAQLLIANTKQKSLSKIIELFSSMEGEGIEISSINVTRIETDQIDPVQLEGSARDRQALADFRDRLLAQEEIDAVDFPISNLAKDSDIFFSITVTMSNKQSI